MDAGYSVDAMHQDGEFSLFRMKMALKVGWKSVWPSVWHGRYRFTQSR